MDFLQQHWAVIAANSWLFVTGALVVASVAWTVIHFLYKHRIEEDGAEIQRLRNKLTELKEEIANKVTQPIVSTPLPVDRYDYPDAGDHGMNLLGQTSTDLVVGQTYSMTAKVPSGSVLKVELAGTPPIYLEQTPHAWAYSTSTRNWQGNLYDQVEHTQIFTAKGGEAELAFVPSRSGKIKVSVYEGGRTVAWEKMLKIIDPKDQ